METCTFQIQYIDAATGSQVTRTLPELRLAQQLARKLAMATGRRAIITRIGQSPSRNPDYLWTVHLAHAESRQLTVLWEGLTKREVFDRWKRWKERRTKCVLIAWPAYLPPIDISFRQTA